MITSDTRPGSMPARSSAALMAIAGIRGGELLVRQRQERTIPVGFEQHGHHRHLFRHGFPDPGKDQLFVLHHFAKDAADVVRLAGRRAH